jgi:hypothetical protein
MNLVVPCLNLDQGSPVCHTSVCMHSSYSDDVKVEG